MSDDLKARAEAALECVTDGPWSEGDTLTRFVFNMTVDPSDPRAVICEAYEDADASFIAASRDLVPELLARVVELETAVSAWQNARQACIKPTISQDELSALAKAEAALAGVVIK